ncbi:SDR family NAD(P)-dependent oxidoreductase [Nonomuraea sp. NPDC050202]|jgi:NAD(P)-dependent dehydrogenase (short-subunit alcohol dehydrogenase family)|uniref:SDR family NAD(P)-dependent oxidoreductase n=1 Tax=Nonomuraea sp. NPDC050202 TaxID=3155035 RepID=UPI0033C93E93
MSTTVSSSKSRVAVVTGAASGMGLAIARRLAEREDRVALFDVQGEAARKAAHQLSTDLAAGAMGCEVDVTDRDAIDAAVRAVHEKFGPVEILVASAGIEGYTPVTDITLSEWERILAVNLTGTFQCIQAVVPDMQAAGWGRIVTISSASAQSGAPNRAHYAAAKGGVISLTKALAFELGPAGITVNTIPPGIIDTPMARDSEKAGNLNVQAAGARMPLRRAGTVEEIAGTCAFLCSDDAGYITGQTIGVNGGYYM